jgi:hypothetical protein
MPDATMSGACLCGAVRFEVEPPSRSVCHCHCNNCRRAHGAGVVTWAVFPERALRLTRGEQTLRRYLTETGATRSFCGTCGSPLFYASPRWPGEVDVAVACLDGPPDQLPSGHTYADRAPAWCPIQDALPRYGGESGSQPLCATAPPAG